VAALVLVPLSAVVALPGEKTVKSWLGVNYGTPGCGEIRDRGRSAAWRAGAPLPVARDEPRAARVGSRVFIAGGLAGPALDRAKSVATFERFDLGTRRFAELPPLPERLNHIGFAAYGGDLYMVGGGGDKLAPFFASPRLWRYRVKTRRWERLASMPTARAALGVAVTGNRLYAVGGADHAGLRATSLKTNEVYDFESGKWSVRAPMPTARDHIGVTAMGGFVYAAGGRNAAQVNQRAFERYDPRTDRWTRLAPLPKAVSGVQLVPLGGRLVVAGGENPKARWVTGAAYAYEPATNTWGRLPRMRTPLHGYAASVAGERLYLFGGSTCSGFRATRATQSFVAGRAGTE
jgi:N-acetylneuraminic acid mutarotase